MELSKLSSFVSFELKDSEQLQGYTFNEAQRAVIQNNIAASAEDILRIQLQKIAPTDEERLQVVFHQGQIAALRYLLDTGDALQEAEKELNKPSEPNESL